MSYSIAAQALAGTTPNPVPTSNTPEVRNLSVGTRWADAAGVPWLTAALEVRGITPEQGPRAVEAIRAILRQHDSEKDYVRWGSGDLRGRIVVRWRPRRADNAVSYATQIARAFLAAGQREFSPSTSFIMRRFKIERAWPFTDFYVYPDTDFSTVTRETLPTELANGVPVEAEGDRQVRAADMLAWGLGIGVGVLVLGGAGLALVAYRRRRVSANGRRPRRNSSERQKAIQSLRDRIKVWKKRQSGGMPGIPRGFYDDDIAAAKRTIARLEAGGELTRYERGLPSE